MCVLLEFITMTTNQFRSQLRVIKRISDVEEKNWNSKHKHRIDDTWFWAVHTQVVVNQFQFLIESNYSFQVGRVKKSLTTCSEQSSMLNSNKSISSFNFKTWKKYFFHSPKISANFNNSSTNSYIFTQTKENFLFLVCFLLFDITTTQSWFNVVEIELSLHERELVSTQLKAMVGKFCCFLLMTAADTKVSSSLSMSTCVLVNVTDVWPIPATSGDSDTSDHHFYVCAFEWRKKLFGFQFLLRYQHEKICSEDKNEFYDEVLRFATWNTNLWSRAMFLATQGKVLCGSRCAKLKYVVGH